jgi:glycosyltransferase involved in cell wall biosynthesis
MTIAAAPRRLRVLTLDQRSDYHRVLYDQLGELVDETGLDNKVDWTQLRRHLAGIDIFHLHWPEWLLAQDLALHRRFAASLRRAGVSLVWSQHNLAAHGSSAAWQPVYEFWAGQADGVIHHSQWGMNVALAILPFRPRTLHAVIPHPHFGPLRVPDGRSRAEMEAELGWRHDALRLTIVGSPRPGKLVPEAAHAVARSPRRDIELRIFSLGPRETSIADPRIMAERYTRVDRVLWDQRLAVSDALVMPFHQTSMLTTGTVADAVTHGLPCLASDWPFLTEVLGGAAIVYGAHPRLLTDMIGRLDREMLDKARDAAIALQRAYSPQASATALHAFLLRARRATRTGPGRYPHLVCTQSATRRIDHDRRPI